MRTFGAILTALSILYCATTYQPFVTCLPWAASGLVCYLAGALVERLDRR